jgi:EmrB/QacA subfamily drug resistance transporter
MTTIIEDPQRFATTASPPVRHSPWLVLFALGLAQLMLVLDATVVNIALPRAQHALRFSDADRQWVVTAYSLAFGSLLLLGGRLGDIVGRRRIFVIGLVGFATASAIGGLATSFTMLVAARVVQGASGAMLAPAALAGIAAAFTDAHERARAFGVFGAISASGASIGLILGGALTEYLSWRWVMYVNVVIAAIALVAGGALMPAEDGPRRRKAIGSPGAALATGGVFAIVYGFSRAGTGKGVSELLAPLTLGFVVAGAVLVAAFARMQTRVADPMLPPHIVRDRDRLGAYAAMFISAVGVFGVLLFLTYYLQGSLGYSPVRTGLAFLPMALTVIVMGGFVQVALSARVSHRTTLPAGLVLAGIGMALLTRVGAEPHYVSVVLPAILVMGVGLGLVYAPSFNMATTGVAESDVGVASATIHVAQQIGGSIGTALLNSVATSVATTYVLAHMSHGPLAAVQSQAAIHSYTIAFWICAASFALAAVTVAVILRRPARSRAVRPLIPSQAALATYE